MPVLLSKRGRELTNTRDYYKITMYRYNFERNKTMKKRLVSLFLVFILLCSLPGASAWAAGRKYINLNSAEAGTYIDLLIAKVNGTAELTEGAVPDGCALYSEERDGGRSLYLRGTLNAAGVYDFTVGVTENAGEAPTEELVCTMTILPAAPTVTLPRDVDCYVGDEVKLELSVVVPGSGTVSYQWFSTPYNTNHDGTRLPDKTERVLIPDTSKVCTTYYYCEITHTENDLSTTINTMPVSVTVAEPVVTSISVNNSPAKLKFKVGDALDTQGLYIQVKYAGGASEIIGSGFGVYPTTLKQAGVQTVTISYKGCSCTYDVLVEEPEDQVDEIRVISMPVKTEYLVGDRLDTAGMKLRVFTKTGYTDVSTGFGCSPTTLSKEGTQTITVTYSGKECTFSVSVKPAKEEIRSVSVISPPQKISYKVGESLDLSGLVLHVETNKETRDVVSGFTCAPTVLNKEGKQDVTVTYEGKTCTFTVDVAAADKPEPVPAEEPTETPGKPEVTPEATHGKEKDAPGAKPLVVIILILSVLALAALGFYAYMTYIAPRKKGKNNKE